MLFLAAALLAVPARGEEPTKPARVGVISVGLSTDSSVADDLRQAMADVGYAEGRNLTIEARYAEGDPGRLPAIIAELLALPIDILYTLGAQATLAAKRQTTTTPIVFQVGDPVGTGLVASLARPGGNLTGVSLLSGEYSRKWLELLKEAVPKIHRVGVLTNPENPVGVEEVRGMQRTASAFALDLVVFSGRASDLDASLAAIASSGVESLVITDDPVLDSFAPRLGAFVREHHLPAISGLRTSVQQGVLMSYSADFHATRRRCTDYIGRILKGAHPADLPVEQASEFLLRINLKTAKALGLAIPQSILARADEMIE